MRRANGRHWKRGKDGKFHEVDTYGEKRSTMRRKRNYGGGGSSSLFMLAAVGAAGYFAYTQGYLSFLNLCPLATPAGSPCATKAMAGLSGLSGPWNV